MKLLDVPKFGLDGMIMRDARVAKVQDGDTITVVHHMGSFRDVRKANVRVLDVDAPDAQASRQEARALLIRTIGAPVDPKGKYAPEFFDCHDVRVDVVCGPFDCFGRILGDIQVGGASIKDALLASALFVPYVQKS
jgi:endonuclease YncB( thermonuclease family)